MHVWNGIQAVSCDKTMNAIISADQYKLLRCWFMSKVVRLSRLYSIDLPWFISLRYKCAYYMFILLRAMWIVYCVIINDNVLFLYHCVLTREMKLFDLTWLDSKETINATYHGMS